MRRTWTILGAMAAALALAPAVSTGAAGAVPPQPPVVTAPVNGAHLASGQVAFTGQAEPSVTIRISDARPEVIATTQTGTGTGWETVAQLPDGQHDLTVTATNQEGEVSGPTGLRIVVDTAQPETTIDTGPQDISPRQARFTFSSNEPQATFECRLSPSETYAPCASPWTSEPLTDGVTYTFSVRAKDLAGNTDETPATRTFVADAVAPTVTITSEPPNPLRESIAVFEFSASEPGVTFTCTHVFPGSDFPETIDCDSGWSPRDLVDGVHRFEISATDVAGNQGLPAIRTVTVDVTPPDAVEPAQSGPATFTFAAEPGATFECRLVGPLGDSGFAPCSSPKTYENLAPGEYTFSLQVIDAAGNRSPETRSRTFTIAAEQPLPEPTATPAATATPRPTATPTPTPEVGETVVARPVSGKILVKRPGSNEFVELRASDRIPVGSKVDAKKGRVALVIEPGQGKPTQRAVFYGGIFKISQPGVTVDLTLSEPLEACKKKARTSATKPKSRKLWGDGKGKFRTKGQYSSATVRGTIWLVQDSCAGTLTRVRQGVVSVRDTVRRKTVLLRASRSYLARPRR